MKRRAPTIGALAVLCVLALALRLPDLGNRPFHADESVHAVKLWEARQRGGYVYNPDEFHGPTLYYAAAPFLAALGRKSIGDTVEADYRLATVAVGVLLVALMGLLSDGLGRRATLVAAALAAVSPAMVFYSRYFIQEMLLACFSVGALGAWWRHARSGHPGWAALAGAFLGLMFASKETASVTLAAWLAAWGVAWFLLPMRPRDPIRWRDVVLAASVAALVAAFLLTGFGGNLGAIPDYFRSYAPWFGRAHGTGMHRHGWDYYLRILVGLRAGSPMAWSEALIPALALAGLWVAVGGCRRRAEAAAAASTSEFAGARPVSADRPYGGLPGVRELHLRVAVSALILLAIYSVVPYKTPWCILSPLAGLIILAGLGADAIVDRAGRRRWLAWTAAAVLALGMAALGRQAYADAYRHQTDPANPYVYAQTVHDAEDIQRRAEALASVHPDGYGMVIKVLWTDDYYWPIPWYLRRFQNVGYWTSMPDDPDAPLIFAEPSYDEALTAKLDPTHIMNGYIGLRPRVVAMVWVKMDLWTRYVERLQRERQESGESGEKP